MKKPRTMLRTTSLWDRVRVRERGWSHSSGGGQGEGGGVEWWGAG